jgi:hypothetical protein
MIDCRAFIGSLLNIQPLQGWHVGAHFPQVAPVAIHIQPLQGWHVGAHFPQVAPVAIHIQPLWGWYVGGTFSTGCTCGYSYSTPLGLVLYNI